MSDVNLNLMNRSDGGLVLELRSMMPIRGFQFNLSNFIKSSTNNLFNNIDDIKRSDLPWKIGGNIDDPIRIQLTDSLDSEEIIIKTGINGLIYGYTPETSIELNNEPLFIFVDNNLREDNITPCVSNFKVVTGNSSENLRYNNNLYHYTCDLDNTGYIKGDLNMDGDVNVIDIVSTINIILGYHEPTQHERWAADINDDGEINVTDIVLMVNKILGN